MSATRAQHPRSPEAFRVDGVLDIAIPVAIRLIEIIVQVALTLTVVPRSTRPFDRRFLIWDAKNYRSITEHGYPTHIEIDPLGHLVHGKELAFFPVFPCLARNLSTLTQITATQSLLAVAIIASCILSVGIHLLTRVLGGTRMYGWLAATLLAATPMSVVLQMGYAEPLFLAFAVFAFYAAIRGHWATAGVLGVLAAGTRPFGMALGLALIVLGMLKANDSMPISRRVSMMLPGLFTMAVSPFIWLMEARHTAIRNVFFIVQEHGWQTKFDAGRSTLELFDKATTSPMITPANGVTVRMITCILIITSIFLTIALAVFVSRQRHDEQRLLWPFIVYAVMVLVITLGSSNFWYSKPRLLLELTPVLAPAVLMVPAHKLHPVKPIVGIMTITAIALSMSFSTFMICLWQRPI